MKCVVADWEIRNLGCKTLECTIETGDTKETLLSEIGEIQKEYKAKYIVIKNSHQFASLNWIIQDMGFVFMEDQLSVTLKRTVAQRKMKQVERMFRDVNWNEMPISCLSSVYKELEKGVFNTDRIALDPYFGLNVANRRYIGWIKDVMHCDGTMLEVENKGRKIGFHLLKKEKNIVQGILAGLYKNDCCVGMGGALFYAGIKHFIEDNNVNYYKTLVSSNNLSSLKMDLFFGYEIVEINHVFVKHYN